MEEVMKGSIVTFESRRRWLELSSFSSVIGTEVWLSRLNSLSFRSFVLFFEWEHQTRERERGKKTMMMMIVWQQRQNRTEQDEEDDGGWNREEYGGCKNRIELCPVLTLFSPFLSIPAAFDYSLLILSCFPHKNYERTNERNAGRYCGRKNIRWWRGIKWSPCSLLSFFLSFFLSFSLLFLSFSPPFCFHINPEKETEERLILGTIRDGANFGFQGGLEPVTTPQRQRKRTRRMFYFCSAHRLHVLVLLSLSLSLPSFGIPNATWNSSLFQMPTPLPSIPVWPGLHSDPFSLSPLEICSDLSSRALLIDLRNAKNRFMASVAHGSNQTREERDEGNGGNGK